MIWSFLTDRHIPFAGAVFLLCDVVSIEGVRVNTQQGVPRNSRRDRCKLLGASLERLSRLQLFPKCPGGHSEGGEVELVTSPRFRSSTQLPQLSLIITLNQQKVNPKMVLRATRSLAPAFHSGFRSS